LINDVACWFYTLILLNAFHQRIVFNRSCLLLFVIIFDFVFFSI
jgi:hypothetical protein